MTSGTLAFDRHRPWRALVRVMLAFATMALSTLLRAQTAVTPTPTSLDRFDDLAPWQVVVSDGVKASIHPADGLAGRAMKLQFDLAGTADDFELQARNHRHGDGRRAIAQVGDGEPCRLAQGDLRGLDGGIDPRFIGAGRGRRQ